MMNPRPPTAAPITHLLFWNHDTFEKLNEMESVVGVSIGVGFGGGLGVDTSGFDEVMIGFGVGVIFGVGVAMNVGDGVGVGVGQGFLVSW